MLSFVLSGNETDRDFGHRGESVSVDGVVWVDDNADGVLDAGETGRTSGITVTLYEDFGTIGVLDGPDVVISTDDSGADGSYHVGGTAVFGDFLVVVDAADLPGGHALTTPGVVAHSWPGGGSAVDNFGHVGPGPLDNTVSGAVFHDVNENGVKDGGETTGFTGLTVELWHDVNANGYIDGADLLLDATLSGVNGAYSFTTPLNASLAVQLDLATVPAATYLTTDNIETAVFIPPGGVVDPDNDFGLAEVAAVQECTAVTTPDYSGPRDPRALPSVDPCPI